MTLVAWMVVGLALWLAFLSVAGPVVTLGALIGIAVAAIVVAWAEG